MRQLVINNRTISTPILTILNDIKKELRNSKLKSIKVVNDDIRCTCPIHKDGQEDKPSCGIYIGESTDDVNYGDFNCFTCGAKGPFFKFVAECFEESIEWAKNWLINNYSDGVIESFVELPPLEVMKKKQEWLDESILKTFQDFHPYMQQRKITQKVAKEFEIKYDSKTECLVFPVRDDKGKLFMLTRRRVNSKKFIIDKDKEKPVYLLYYIKQKDIREVTICESQINALTLWGYGFPALATFGCNITDKQFDLLNKSDINHYYLALDGDAAGKKGTIKFIENIRPDVFVDVIILPEGKDVNDLTEEEFTKLPIMEGREWLYKYGK